MRHNIRRRRRIRFHRVHGFLITWRWQFFPLVLRRRLFRVANNVDVMRHTSRGSRCSRSSSNGLSAMPNPTHSRWGVSGSSRDVPSAKALADRNDNASTEHANGHNVPRIHRLYTVSFKSREKKEVFVFVKVYPDEGCYDIIACGQKDPR